MKAFVAQLKRELWEHPVLYLAPMVIMVTVLAFALWLAARADGLALASLIVEDDETGLAQRVQLGMTAVLMLLSPAFMIPSLAVVASYLLSCLGTERRDRSILFFKSLPVSDTVTVLSKLTTALLVGPAFALAGLVVTEVGVFALASVELRAGGASASMFWDPGQLLATCVLAIYTVTAFMIWHAPSFCFLLVVSAWARRAATLWALSPLLVVLVERSLTGRSMLGRVLSTHWDGFWSAALNHPLGISPGGNPVAAVLENLDVPSATHLWSWMDPVGLLTSSTLWAGLVVAVGFTVAAIALRRYRDDS